MDKITGFLPGIVKIPTSAQMSRFTTTWLSSRFHKIFQNCRKFRSFGVNLTTKTNMAPSTKEFRPFYKGDSSCQKTHNSGISYQTISGTRSHDMVVTSDRFQFIKQSFTCADIQDGNSRIYQEIDSKRGVGHLDRPHRRLFPCSNTSTISKISEISDQKKGFSSFKLFLLVSRQLP